MRPEVQIDEIASCGWVAPLLGGWHAAEWGHLYEGFTAEVAAAELAAMSVPGAVPTTFVAFAGGGRSEADVLGSVSLFADDELEGFAHLTPWLGSLYVRESARGLGVGRALVDAVVAAAGRLGVPAVHLFTEGQEAYYRATGWETIARPQAHGHVVAVMRLRLTG